MLNKKRIRTLLLWLGGAVALYSLIGFLLLPALVKSQAVVHVETSLGHKLSLGEVRFNPFTLTAEITDFDLREASGNRLVAFQRLFVNFETSSLLRRAWAFAVVEVAAPVLKFELRPDGTHNFSALIAKLQRSPPAPEGPMPRVEINLFQVSAGRVELADLQAGESATLHLTPITFELTELSTLPSEGSSYKLSARSTDGESIQWGGEIVLNPFSSIGQLTLQGWQVATLTRILGNRVALHDAGGQVGISFDYRAALARGAFSLLISNAQASIDDLRLTSEAGAAPLVDLKRLALTASSFDLVQRTVAIETVELSGARVALAIDTEGKPNWSALLPRTAPASPDPTSDPITAQASNAPAAAPLVPPPVPPSAEPKSWTIKLDQFTAQGLALDFVDQRAASAAKVAFAEGTLSASGTAQIDPITATLNLDNVNFAFANVELDRAAEKVALKAIELSASQWTSSSKESRLQSELSNPKVAATGISVQQAEQSWQLGKGSVSAQSIGIGTATGADTTTNVQVAALTLEGEGLRGRIGTKTELVQLKQFSAGAKTLAMDGSDMQIKGEALRAGLDVLILRDPATGAELARLARAEAIGGTVSTKQRSAQVERITLSDAHANATLDGSGKLDWDAFLAAFAPSHPAGKSTSAAVASKGSPSSAPPTPSWDASVKLIELSRFGAAYTDQRAQSALAIALQDVNARVRNTGTKTKTPAGIEINGRIKDSGQFRVAGNVDVRTFASDVKLKLDGISLTPAQPFLAQQARLQIVSALASAEGRLRYGKPKEAGAGIVFEGELGLDKVVIEETEPAQPFLALDSLRASQVKLALGPNSLDIPDLRLNRLVTKLLIAEDQSVNLVKVLRKQPSQAQPASAPAVATDGAAPPVPPRSSPAAAPPDDAFPLSLARIRIDHSALEFADLALRPQFSTRMHELQGVITGVSSSRDSRARLELDARVDEFGAAIIRGSINPFEPRAYTQVDLDFRNIAMSALTPYSAKFAGYRITSGQLSMNLQYRIKNSALQGNNKIVLDKLVLGERVDSPGALNLPLELALAILRDANGRIDIGLPVSGSLDDPQFSIGGLVWKAIGNLLTRIVTAPFRALAGLFGGGENEQLGSIEFDPGSEALRPPERQKLRTVAEALQKRPQLKLTVKPAYATETDRAALQSLAVRRAIVTRAGIKLEPGEAPGPLDVSSAKTQQAIEALFVERFGMPAARDLRASLTKQTSAPRAGAAKATADQATVAAVGIAQTMSERLIEAQSVSVAELAELATRRGAAIVQELQIAGKVEAARLASNDPKSVDAKNGAVISDLDLTVVK